MKMDHDTCSELLRPYVAGELDAGASAELEEHLGSCDECRAEERGLRALLEPAPEGMTELERAGLRRDLRSRLEIPAAAPARRMAWLPPALTAAAMLLVVVVGIQLFSGASNDDGDAGSSEGAGDVGAMPAPVTLRFAGQKVERYTMTRMDSELSEESGSDFHSDEAGGSEGATTDQGSAREENRSAPQPEAAPPADAVQPTGKANVVSARPTIERALTRYARSGKQFVSFAETYSADDVEDLRDEFTAVLADQAPDEEAAAQVAECADFVIDAQPYPSLPVVAAHGKFRGDDSLMLGFVWSQGDTGPLNRFVLFVWPTGTCDSASHSQFGRVKTK